MPLTSVMMRIFVKKLSVFALTVLLAGAAHADWVPRVLSDRYVATVSYGGNSISYSEDRYANGPLGALARDVYGVPAYMQSSLNNLLQQQAAANGVTFVSGTLSGNVNFQVTPQSNGTVLLRMSGLRYDAYTKYSGKKWGIIKYDCTNHLTLADMTVTAQYGTVDGSLPSDKVGLTMNASSSTDCDSNLSWILPVLGNYIINKAEGQIDQGVVEGIKGSLTEINSKLVFGRDQNYLASLNRLIPVDKVITLPDGRTFPIGQYINNNLAYLIANSQITLQLGKGVKVEPVLGVGEPSRETFTGDIINLSVTAPGVSFNARLHEEVNVYWSWKCSVRNPLLSCPIP